MNIYAFKETRLVFYKALFCFCTLFLQIHCLKAQSLITEDPYDPDGPSVSVAADLLIGDSATPQDLHLHGDAHIDGSIGINGVLNISDSTADPDTATPTAGAIRWNGSDFQGYDGDAWKSFTESITAPTSTLTHPNKPTVPIIEAHSNSAEIKRNTEIKGNLIVNNSVVLKSSNKNVTSYFKWVHLLPHAKRIEKTSNTIPNQVIYVDLGAKTLWGAVTVTITGNHHSGRNTGMIRKTFAVSHNHGWTNGSDAEHLDVAMGPIKNNFKIGSLTAENGSVRIPIYKIRDTLNKITVYVEGHMGLISAVHNVDPNVDFSISDWELTEVDHVPERIHLDVENIAADTTQLNPVVTAPVNATAGAIYFDAATNDFQGYDGSEWKSLTVSLPSGPQGDLSMGRFTSN